MISKLSDLFLKSIKTTIIPYWQSIILWRTITILILIIIGVSILYRKTVIAFLLKEKYLDHDKSNFLKTDNNLKEDQFIKLYDNLLLGKKYYESEKDKLDNFICFFELQGNQYLIRDLKNKSKTLVSQLKKLSTFLSLNFFLHPDDQPLERDYRYVIHPHLKNEHGDKHKQYLKSINELGILVIKTKIKYDDYRESIQRNLFI